MLCLKPHRRPSLFNTLGLTLLLVLIAGQAGAQTVSFNSPDTVCVNMPVNLTNTSVGGTSYYWTFCVSDLNATPVATNLGNGGGQLYGPAFMDYAYDAATGNYYGYVVNNYPGALIQLNFGPSLLNNNPTQVSLGSLGGNLYNSEEGIQLVQNGGNWYAIIVGGTPASGGVSSIVTVNFGPSLSNTTPTSTNWGNIGNLSYPTDLKLVQDGGQWYGFTVNATNNTVTRFDFGTNFNVAPTGTNLGNLGGLSQPTGMSIIQQGGIWYMYLVNQTNNSLTRLDFGNSVTNTPAAVNLGDPSNALNQPRAMTTVQSCGTTKGFVVNFQDNSISRVDFPSGPASDTLTGENLGNLGNMSFPQSISRIFQEGPDLYMFVTNVTNSTITRFVFSGCDTSVIPPSTLQNPPPVTYTSPGIYHISLQMNVGLPSQQSFCKSVVVLGSQDLVPDDTSACTGDKLILRAQGFPNGVYNWSTGSDSSATLADTAGRYWVTMQAYGCTSSDTIKVALGLTPPIYLPADTQFCDSGKLKYASALPVTYTWSTGSDSAATEAYANGQYKLVLNNGGCLSADSTQVTIRQPVPSGLPKDTSFCGPDSLRDNPVAGYTYTWSTGANTPDIGVATSGLYWLEVNQGVCAIRDSTQVTVNSPPTVTLGNDTSICTATGYDLKPNTQPPGSTYSWQDGSTADSLEVPQTGIYSVTVTSPQGCKAAGTVAITLDAPVDAGLPKDTTFCGQGSLTGRTTSGGTYVWNTGAAGPSIPVTTTGLYWMEVDRGSCSDRDSTQVTIASTPVVSLGNDTSVCVSNGYTLIPNAQPAGSTYRWQDGNTNASYIVIQTGVYSVRVVNPQGCADSASVAINGLPLPVIDFGSGSIPFCPGEVISIRPGVDSVPYTWQDGSTDSVYLVKGPGTYTATATNVCGSATASILVYQGVCIVRVPSAFTPNGDGINDIFKVLGTESVDRFEFAIYNRWGQLVFKTSDPLHGWDGTFHGIAQPQDAYVYDVHFRYLVTQQSYQLSGTVTLIR